MNTQRNNDSNIDSEKQSRDFSWIKRESLAMLADFYEFTMSNGFLERFPKDITAYYDVFFRKVPDNGGFVIAAGLGPVIDFIRSLRFEEDDIEYLRQQKLFSENFLEFLKNFRFTCDLWAIPEGTPVFPYEPIMVVRGPVLEAQLIETMLLLLDNYGSRIATKSVRVNRAAQGRAVVDFGARRAHGPDAAVLGARSAYIGGCTGTSCTLAGKHFGIPVMGTMAHSWVQMFPSELEAFKAFAQVYPNNCILLVDTYNVLKSGVPNAIMAFNEELVPKGFRPKGIRIDSGDLAYLSKQARKMLDEAGFTDCKIMASNSLDEYLIGDLISQGAEIDAFGVGERLITAKSDAVLGGVYKLVAMEQNGEITPRIKISENVEKIITPGFKQVYRLYGRNNGKAIADVITLFDEVIDDTRPYEIFDPVHTWKRKKVTNFRAEPLLVRIFDKGNLIYRQPKLDAVRNYCAHQLGTLWEEVLRFENPHRYYVDLSKPLWDMKQQLLLSSQPESGDGSVTHP